MAGVRIGEGNRAVHTKHNRHHCEDRNRNSADNRSPESSFAVLSGSGQLHGSAIGNTINCGGKSHKQPCLGREGHEVHKVRAKRRSCHAPAAVAQAEEHSKHKTAKDDDRLPEVSSDNTEHTGRRAIQANNDHRDDRTDRRINAKISKQRAAGNDLTAQGGDCNTGTKAGPNCRHRLTGIRKALAQILRNRQIVVVICPACGNKSEQHIGKCTAQAVPCTADTDRRTIGRAADHNTGADMSTKVGARVQTDRAALTRCQEVLSSLCVLLAPPADIQHKSHINDKNRNNNSCIH